MASKIEGTGAEDLVIEASSVAVNRGVTASQHFQNTVVSHENGSKNYEFDPVNDIKLFMIKDKIHLRISIKVDIVNMILNNIKFIRLILTKGHVKNLYEINVPRRLRQAPGNAKKGDLYETNNEDVFVKEIYFNVDDYINSAERKEIKERNYYKKIKIITSDLNESLISNVVDLDENIDMLLRAIKNKSTSGEMITPGSDIIRTIEENNSKSSNTETTNVLTNHVMMKMIVDLTEIDSNLWVKILEVNENSSSYNSIHDFDIGRYSAIIGTKFIEKAIEKNNILKAFGHPKPQHALHHINVINEVHDKVKIYKKSGINSRFKRLNIDDTSSTKETLIKIPGSNDCIYRIVDRKKTFEDVFIGDVKKEFFTEKPSASSITTMYGNVIIVKQAPYGFSSYKVTRKNKNNSKTQMIIDTRSFSDITMRHKNYLILYDSEVDHNKIYSYKVTFFTKDGSSIETTDTNFSKFIKTSGKYSMTVSSVDTHQGKSISFETKVPDTDSSNVYDAIKGYFPDLGDEEMTTILESYQFISFVKLMSLNRKTGTVKTLGTKTAIRSDESSASIASFDIDESEIDKNDVIYFGEMFASPIITLLDNIKASGHYESGTADYLPAGSITKDNSFDSYNFNSKFFSYDSMNSGTLTYGLALANEPGKIIESGKTGVIEFLDFEEEEEQEHKLLNVSLLVVDRETPVISIESSSNKIDSVIIFSSSSMGLRVIKEKSLVGEDKSFTFYDVKAKDEHLNETITYHVLPVYNNYNLGAFLMAGTVLCLKDDFRKM